MELKDLTQTILEQIPPEARFSPESAAAIARNKEFLLGLEEALIPAFYNPLFGHPRTAEIFHEGERPDREETLRQWWHRTVDSPIDQSYWEWMTLVGLVHVRRQVKNPMMLAMWNLIVSLVETEGEKKLPPAEVGALTRAFTQLSSTVGSLIAESYTETYIGALADVAGLEPALSARMVRMQVEELESKARQG